MEFLTNVLLRLFHCWILISLLWMWPILGYTVVGTISTDILLTFGQQLANSQLTVCWQWANSWFRIVIIGYSRCRGKWFFTFTKFVWVFNNFSHHFIMCMKMLRYCTSVLTVLGSEHLQFLKICNILFIGEGNLCDPCWKSCSFLGTGMKSLSLDSMCGIYSLMQCQFCSNSSKAVNRWKFVVNFTSLGCRTWYRWNGQNIGEQTADILYKQALATVHSTHRQGRHYYYDEGLPRVPCSFPKCPVFRCSHSSIYYFVPWKKCSPQLFGTFDIQPQRKFRDVLLFTCIR